jgi:AcrR family transcriptional regulator
MNEKRKRAKDATLLDFIQERVKEHLGEAIQAHLQEHGRLDLSRDTATRARLLGAAMRLFARDGFRHVTVRDIAREARANVAAVNYHFGDKFKLYLSVVQDAIEEVRETIDETMRAAEDLAPEDKLRHYLRTSFSRALAKDDQVTEVQRLFRQEMMEPSPAAEMILDRVVRPRLRWLAKVVGEMIDADSDDPRVQRCVASIQGQLLFHMASPMRHLLFESPRSQAEVDAEIEHILEFSLAGIRAIAGSDVERRRRGKRGA